MDWLGIRFLSEFPPAGQMLLHCTHNPWLVLLAYLIACAGSFATLDMAERLAQSETAGARRRWRWLGAACLACGIWAMHFISMLAFQTAMDVHYDLPITIASLLIALFAGLLAMNLLSRPTVRLKHYALTAAGMGLAICAMHYIGMAAMRSDAQAYYAPWPFAGSIALAIVVSLMALAMARHFRQGSGSLGVALKYAASALMGTGIVSAHFSGMAALHLTVPTGRLMDHSGTDNGLQLSLTIATITLLIIASSISSALADKKLLSKELDLRRVNALLSQLDQARVQLQQAAHYDALTSLVNRRGFNELFAQRLAVQQRDQGMLAVMFLDIDHFKRINDSLGHDVGDALLKAIAQIIKGATRRDDDVVARFGGDEFCILIAMNKRDDAKFLAQRIMTRMKQPIELAGRRLVMTTSIGVSVFPDNGDTCEELLKNADLALYQSKGSGRNSLHFFSGDLRAKATLALQLEEELRNALHHEGGLELHYQPILDLRSGRVGKLEALIRWRHPQHGLLAPDRFLEVARTNGLIMELDAWVMRRACRDLASFGRQGDASLRVAINCSPQTLARPSWPGEVAQALAETGLAAHRLELEITEHALMTNIQQTVARLDEIKAQGVTISIDDFGTGHSSLAYLRNLPLDTVKIDRSFITHVPEALKDRELVQAIIAMAHTLRLQVVTEGVETAEQMTFLEGSQCDHVQGYLLSRPVPLVEIPAVLNRLERRHLMLV
ncbi:putative bifunctional diguanylate cyclase/phosphodiesterase [Pseudomonas sp. UBA4194]|uniref:putative bifunctional diguanylate cyclase/phosphodiesterase n=1 Tax=Pseudomonas sp. UBA4194 TaxID=1947317 RepID=UPI0025EF337C|nr:bifunctional diguanylate cyclase/phosphodiesterase [Pseudomonas sp. UBA4194]